MTDLYFHALVFSAVVRASYLAVHEFKVDSFQSDLQQTTFTSFHVLDGKLSAQLRTWGTQQRSLEPKPQISTAEKKPLQAAGMTPK